MSAISNSIVPQSTKDNIPIAQTKRITRIVSNTQKRNNHLYQLIADLKNRGYPEKSLRFVKNVINNGLREFQREPSSSKVIPLILEYNDDWIPLIDIIKNLRPILNQLEIRIPIYWRRTKNIKDMLVKSNILEKQPNIPPNIVTTISDDNRNRKIQKRTHKCYKIGCKTCPMINTSREYKSVVTGLSYFIKSATTCRSSNVVYLIGCSLCQRQYVGETKCQLNTRLAGHRTCIKHSSKYPNPVATHFNICGIKNLTIQALESCSSDKERKRREMFYISQLVTDSPHGINEDYAMNSKTFK